MIRFRGLRRLRAGLFGASPRLRRRMRKNLTTAARLVQRAARAEIGGDRDSNPSDRLGRESGKLARSITYSVRVGRRTARAVVGPAGFPETLYGRVHELGLEHWPQRPFLAPAVDKNLRELQRLLGRGTIQRVIR